MVNFQNNRWHACLDLFTLLQNKKYKFLKNILDRQASRPCLSALKILKLILIANKTKQVQRSIEKFWEQHSVLDTEAQTILFMEAKFLMQPGKSFERHQLYRNTFTGKALDKARFLHFSYSDPNLTCEALQEAEKHISSTTDCISIAWEYTTLAGDLQKAHFWLEEAEKLVKTSYEWLLCSNAWSRLANDGNATKTCKEKQGFKYL